MPSPTYPPPQPVGLSPTLARNIRALKERRQVEERSAGLEDRVAALITRFAGSMTFVYIHASVFGLWTLVNAGLLPGISRWDESFVILGTLASVEAIFLSTFVLISQNRMQASANSRADLDLQISLLAEHEVTRLVTLVKAVAAKLEVESAADDDTAELEQDVSPDSVLDEIERSARAG